MPVKVLHLVRDGRGVMASKIKGDNRAMKKGEISKDRFAGFRGLAGWLSANVFAFITGLLLPKDSYCLIRYERLLEQPEAELSSIGAFLGLDMKSVIRKIEHNGSFSNGHRVAGNRMAVEKDIRVRKTLPAWTGLPLHLTLLYSLLGWPVAACIHFAEYRRSRNRRNTQKNHQAILPISTVG